MNTRRVTPQSKIVNVTDKLGLGGIKNQQGAAVSIFDSVIVASNAQRQTLTFFKNTSTKSRNFTNWQQGEFKAGETLAVEYLSLYLVTLTNSNLADDANAITAFTYAGGNVPIRNISQGMAQLKIANDTVFKDFLLSEMNPELNPANSGIAGWVSAAGNIVAGRSEIKLPATPIIPPNQGIELTIDIPPVTIAGTQALVAVLGRTGSIFASKTTL